MGSKTQKIRYVVVEADKDCNMTGLFDGWYAQESDAQQVCDHMNAIGNGFGYFVDNNHELGDFKITADMSLKKKALDWN